MLQLNRDPPIQMMRCYLYALTDTASIILMYCMNEVSCQASVHLLARNVLVNDVKFLGLITQK